MSGPEFEADRQIVMARHRERAARINKRLDFVREALEAFEEQAEELAHWRALGDFETVKATLAKAARVSS